MERLILFIWLLFLPVMLSQEQGEDPQYPDTELTLQITDTPNSTIVFDFIPVGTIFCNSSGSFQSISTPTYSHTLVTNQTGDILCEHNGFDIRFCSESTDRIVSGCAQSTSGVTPLRWGFYKLTVKVGGVQKGYCYIDWRDTEFPVGPGSGCLGNDITIRYHGGNQTLRFFNMGGPSEGNQDFTTLTNGQIINWAVVKGCYERNFSPFWSNGLVSINYNDHPKLIWGPYDESFQTTQYRIYRKVGTSSWNIAGYVGSNTFEYTDSNVDFNPKKTDIKYYIKAYNGSSESPATNTVIVLGDFNPSKEAYESLETKPISNELFDCYPNPFNPTTTFSFSLSEGYFTTLKVYDVLGNEVKTLINDYKPTGSHSINYDASNLPSGIYFYTITSGNFSKTKKMILTK